MQQASISQPATYMPMFILGKLVKKLWFALSPSSKAMTTQKRKACVAPPSASARLLFNPRMLNMTFAVHALAMQGALSPATFVTRHVCGDWGNVSDSVKVRNNAVLRGDLKQGKRLMSSFTTPCGNTVIIMTNLGSGFTSVMLRGELASETRRT
ncbi:MAG: hypothetical protein FWD67_12495 [Betaproteobacteria bacterium]|nr:hypothetical protein [Betaproteobacteria bacterium]